MTEYTDELSCGTTRFNNVSCSQWMLSVHPPWNSVYWMN